VKRESDTRQKLLTTAVSLIWESSYGSISVDDICNRAGVNKGSFYYAFKSKSDLAVAAFEDHWNKKRGAMDEIFSSQVPPLERVEKYCDRIVQDQLDKFQLFGKLCGCPFASVGSELSTQDEQIRKKAHELSERTMKYLACAFRDAAAEGILDIKDSVELARQVFCYAGGLIMQAKIENNPELLKCLKKGVFRLVGVNPSRTAI
ncbi:MAG: TetR/AcrR family transcriptional regulator, partial [Verrucomicrobia bacterium]|nr:TetR/AcrR family transcriptional regulator [Verrucomicrobiota bacterium]